jgi:hypothetical protein
MNKLSIERQTQIIKVLCEGNSIRSTARITNTAINTVITLLKKVGFAAFKYQDEHLVNLQSERIEFDEIWSFCYAKESNLPEERKNEWGVGDVWTFTAIDSDSKLVVSWLVSERNVCDTADFMKDIKNRITNHIQLSMDGHKMYYLAVPEAFGDEVEFGMIAKAYGTPLDDNWIGKYSPPRIRKIRRKRIIGRPDKKSISTSYVERQNFTMRMNMRRFTRPTNGFSKKIENHMLAIALYFMHYNFVKTHKTLANPYPRTPAMAAGITDHIWNYEELIELIYLA